MEAKQTRKQKQKELYPGVREAEAQKTLSALPIYEEEEPDFIGNAPNYDKFKGWTAEEVLVWLNID